LVRAADVFDLFDHQLGAGDLPPQCALSQDQGEFVVGAE